MQTQALKDDRMRRDGIPLHDGLRNDLLKLAQELGVTPPPELAV